MYGEDIEEVIPPDVSGLDLGVIRDILPTSDEVVNGLWAGGGVIGGLIVGKAVEKFALDTLRAPRFVIPFIHAGLGVVLGKMASRYSAPLGVGVVGAYGALALVRALDVFFNIKVAALSGFESADLGDLADLLAETDDLLPPELQGFEQVTSEDVRGIGEDYAYDMQQVTVESVGGWVMG